MAAKKGFRGHPEHFCLLEKSIFLSGFLPAYIVDE
jgi:hypothetical protein